MSLIDVTFTSYPVSPERADYLRRTILSLREWLRTPGHDVRWMCVTETQRVDFAALAMVERICEEFGVELFRQLGAPCKGKGVNLLRTMQRGDYSLDVQDDWELTQLFDVNETFEMLAKHPKFLLVQYRERLVLRDPVSIDGGPYFVAPNFREYKYNDNPHLKSAEFWRVVGPYPEMPSGVDERTMDETVRRLDVPVALREPGLFRHIGQVSSRKAWYAEAGHGQLEFGDRVVRVLDGIAGKITVAPIEDGHISRYHVEFDNGTRQWMDPMDIRPV